MTAAAMLKLVKQIDALAASKPPDQWHRAALGLLRRSGQVPDLLISAVLRLDRRHRKYLRERAASAAGFDKTTKGLWP